MKSWHAIAVGVATTIAFFAGIVAVAQVTTVPTPPSTTTVLRAYTVATGIEIRAADGVTPIFRIEGKVLRILVPMVDSTFHSIVPTMPCTPNPVPPPAAPWLCPPHTGAVLN